jgi:hypothetical protein
VVRLKEPAEVAARNARLADNPDAPVARFDWIWSYDVVGAVADGASLVDRAIDCQDTVHLPARRAT